MEILGLIPARGGSKSITRKNIVPLAGRPLLSYTCEAALASKTLTRVILSTDDEEIAAVGRKFGVEVPFLRPASLAQDETPSFPVIKHVLDWLGTHEGYKPEVIVLLQPTSPLRQAKHIDESIALFLKTGADSVVSVVEVPHHYNPVSVMIIENDRLVPFLPGEGNRILRRQDKPRVYARNGPAICVLQFNTLRRYGNIYGSYSVGYLMSQIDSIDIDNNEDLFICESILQSKERIIKGD